MTGIFILSYLRPHNARMEGVWASACGTESSRLGANEWFMYRLRYRLLPTPATIQKHNHFLPRLYCDNKCPLCRRYEGIEHHIFCRCYKLGHVRERAFHIFEKALASTVKRTIGVRESEKLSKALFPLNEIDFKYGLTPSEVREVLALDLGLGETVEKVAKKVSILITNLYKSVWEGYRELMSKGKLTLTDRLKTEYNMTVRYLRKHHRQLKENFSSDREQPAPDRVARFRRRLKARRRRQSSRNDSLNRVDQSTTPQGGPRLGEAHLTTGGSSEGTHSLERQLRSIHREHFEVRGDGACCFHAVLHAAGLTKEGFDAKAMIGLKQRAGSHLRRLHKYTPLFVEPPITDNSIYSSTISIIILQIKILIIL